MKLCDLDEIKICVNRQYENCHGYSGNKKAIYREAILAVKSILHSAKPIDAVEVRHGQWERTADGAALCTACKRKMNPSQYGYAFCSLCGAKMDGGTD